MKRITSGDNPIYALLRKQVRQPRARRLAKAAILDGAHLLQAALDAGIAPDLVVAADNRLGDPDIAALLARVPERALLAVPPALARDLSTVETPTGLVARIAVPERTPASGAAVLLEDIQDPGNLGSILRSAAAAGVRNLLLSSGCADAWSAKVLRAGMGAHFSLSIRERVDLPAAARALPGPVIATEPRAPLAIYDAELPEACAFVFGNEGAGLSASLRGAATLRVAIPMPGGGESLNVAAAAAICLFEWVRRRVATG